MFIPDFKIFSNSPKATISFLHYLPLKANSFSFIEYFINSYN
jgi:hypothetical protein